MRGIISLFLFCFVAFGGTVYGGSNKRFSIEREAYDKYEQMGKIMTRNNWVRTNEGYYIGFDMAIATKEGRQEKDHYLVLREYLGPTLSLTFSGGKRFSIGENVILTINGCEKIRLKTSVIASYGQFSCLSNGDFSNTTYLEKLVFDKILKADSVYFEIQGNQYSDVKEVTGYIHPRNIENLRQLECCR